MRQSGSLVPLAHLKRKASRCNSKVIRSHSNDHSKTAMPRLAVECRGNNSNSRHLNTMTMCHGNTMEPSGSFLLTLLSPWRIFDEILRGDIYGKA
jgi:hypothetical protein